MRKCPSGVAVVAPSMCRILLLDFGRKSFTPILYACLAIVYLWHLILCFVIALSATIVNRGEGMMKRFKVYPSVIARVCASAGCAILFLACSLAVRIDVLVRVNRMPVHIYPPSVGRQCRRLALSRVPHFAVNTPCSFMPIHGVDSLPCC